MMPSPDAAFWAAIDVLVESSEISVDRPAGFSHPKYPDCVYPLDYGYLSNTSSMDGEGIDCWVGSGAKRVNGMICTVDLCKRDSEMKLLIGCTEQETETVLRFHNQSDGMKGVLIKRT